MVIPSFHPTCFIVKALKVVADKIRTQTLEVNGQFMGKTITTTNGDIAYHFLLHDDTQQFAEGEVVGFVEGEDNQTVEKLTLSSSKHSKLRGVITRSQYFEAQKPKGKGMY